MKLKKEIGLLEGTAITIGSIIGSGIFISPKGIVELVGSVGLSLVVWIICGGISAIGAICYAELGTTFPGSGSDYNYLQQAFGPIPGFLYLWAAIMIFIPTTNAILALTFAKYVTQSFFPAGCEIPLLGLRLLAASAICLLTFLNCYDVRKTSQIQNAFMFGKVFALIVIILVGFIAICSGSYDNFSKPFENSETDPGTIALAVYYGLFAFSGWNTLNYMTEELENPTKNLPRAIFISIGLTTFTYFLTNVAYFAVLSPTEMLASNAVAVTFLENQFPVIAWLMPVFVGMSTFGGLSIHIMTCSRLLFVGARQGHFPQMLSLINVSRCTPMTSLVFLGTMSLFYLTTSNIYSLIEFSAFVYSLVMLTSVSTLLYLRWKKPNLNRPIKVSIVYPIIFTVVCIFLCVLPIYVRPVEAAVGFGIVLTGLPVYALMVFKKPKAKWFLTTIGSIQKAIQTLFLSVKEV